MFASLLAVAVLTLQGAAAAAPPADGVQPAAGAAPAVAGKPAKPPKPKSDRICVEEQMMGSLFPKRVCATAEEWEKRRLRDQEAMTRSGNSSNCGIGGGGGC